MKKFEKKIKKIIQAVLYPQLASPEENIALILPKRNEKGTFNL